MHQSSAPFRDIHPPRRKRAPSGYEVLDMTGGAGGEQCVVDISGSEGEVVETVDAEEIRTSQASGGHPVGNGLQQTVDSEGREPHMGVSEDAGLAGSTVNSDGLFEVAAPYSEGETYRSVMPLQSVPSEFVYSPDVRDGSCVMGGEFSVESSQYWEEVEARYQTEEEGRRASDAHSLPDSLSDSLSDSDSDSPPPLPPEIAASLFPTLPPSTTHQPQLQDMGDAEYMHAGSGVEEEGTPASEGSEGYESEEWYGDGEREGEGESDFSLGEEQGFSQFAEDREGEGEGEREVEESSEVEVETVTTQSITMPAIATTILVELHPRPNAIEISRKKAWNSFESPPDTDTAVLIDCENCGHHHWTQRIPSECIMGRRPYFIGFTGCITKSKYNHRQMPQVQGSEQSDVYMVYGTHRNRDEADYLLSMCCFAWCLLQKFGDRAIFIVSNDQSLRNTVNVIKDLGLGNIHMVPPLPVDIGEDPKVRQRKREDRRRQRATGRDSRSNGQRGMRGSRGGRSGAAFRVISANASSGVIPRTLMLLLHLPRKSGTSGTGMITLQYDPETRGVSDITVTYAQGQI
ncbi:hypothetical protein KIPB_001783 [Kipferlia bialata]|uniref:NYN domain-containing protein n=1 Tax=Kipferlia bialata TaxID=797122 RepID=A0A9K3CPF5_9EUKA|nr:hypothetical protein KIPB_001783 [Kipferlia bialata]|eukprot:g1783.t1